LTKKVLPYILFFLFLYIGHFLYVNSDEFKTRQALSNINSKPNDSDITKHSSGISKPIIKK